MFPVAGAAAGPRPAYLRAKNKIKKSEVCLKVQRERGEGRGMSKKGVGEKVRG